MQKNSISISSATLLQLGQSNKLHDQLQINDQIKDIQAAKENLLNWVKQFNYSYCQTIQSFEELRNGIVICELIHEILLDRNEPTFLSKIQTENLNNSKACLLNHELALNKLKKIFGSDIPLRILQIKPQSLYNNLNNDLLKLMLFLQEINVNKLHKQHKQNENYKHQEPNKQSAHNNKALNFSQFQQIVQYNLNTAANNNLQNATQEQHTLSAQKLQENQIEQKNQRKIRFSHIEQDIQNLDQVIKQEQRTQDWIGMTVSDISNINNNNRNSSNYDNNGKDKNKYNNNLSLNHTNNANCSTKNIVPNNQFNSSFNLYQNQLSKKSLNIQIVPVTLEKKQELAQWLLEIQIIKQKYGFDITKDLPKICKDGVIFCDIINRCSGKENIIKGLYRNPISEIQIHYNLRKLFQFLAQQQKFAPRYLWSSEYIMYGDDDVFWGLLEDIQLWAKQKTSPYDDRDVAAQKFRESSVKSKSQISLREKESLSQRNPSYSGKYSSNMLMNKNCDDCKENIGNFNRNITYADLSFAKQLSPKGKSKVSNYTSVQLPSKDRSVQQKPSLEEQQYQQNYLDKQSFLKSQVQDQILDISPIKQIQDLSQINELKKPQSQFFNNTSMKQIKFNIDLELQSLQFLNQIGFYNINTKMDQPLFQDKLRNGVLLLQVIDKLKLKNFKIPHTAPQNIEECKQNIKLAIQILSNKKIKIQDTLLSLDRVEDIIKGNYNLIWNYYYCLKQHYQNEYFEVKACFKPENYEELKKLQNHMQPLQQQKQQFQEKKNSYKQLRVSKSISQIKPNFQNPLPYTMEQIADLEKSALLWINQIIYNNKQEQLQYQQVEPLFRNGVLLCDLTATVMKIELKKIHRNPTSKHSCLANINKALEILRNNDQIGQKFLWSMQDVFDGNKYVILGLIEDIRRYVDELPPRNGYNYFYEGPYLGKGAFPAELSNKQLIEPQNQKPSSVQIVETKKISQNQSSAKQPFGVEASNREKINQRPDIAQTKSNSISTNPQKSANKKNCLTQNSISLFNLGNKQNSISNLELLQTNHFLGIKLYSQYQTNKENEGTGADKLQDSQHKYLLENLGYQQNIPEKNTRKSSASQLILGRQLLTEQDFPDLVSQDITPQKIRKQEDHAELDKNQQETLVWLIELGYKEFIENIDFSKEVIEEFKDGIFICKLIEKLEMRNIDGLIQKPETQGSCAVNIKKAFQLLKQKAYFDKFLLDQAEKLQQGNKLYILSLLQNIKNAYKSQLTYTNKLKQSMTTFLQLSGSKKLNQSSEKKETLYYYKNRPEKYVLNEKERSQLIVTPSSSQYLNSSQQRKFQRQ